MPKKKSIKLAVQRFDDAADNIMDFFRGTAGLKEEYNCWCADYAIIRLYREFENLMLDALAGAINNDARTISSTVGFTFPKHMTDNVCRYLIVGTGYFDFKGRDGLIKIVKDFVPGDHYLIKILKDSQFKSPLERLSGLRNLAAHESEKAKEAARKAVGTKIGSAGSWLRTQDRMEALCNSLKKLSSEIDKKAPY